MTIEQKAKAYDEAIKVARSKIKNDKDHVLYEDDVIEILPELKENKENEDEKWIPKEIAKYLKEKGGFRSCWITWLEKQGEREPAEKVEPKFKVGDTIHEIGENTIYPITIEEISNNDETYIGNNGRVFISFNFQDDYELVEPKFKVGDRIRYKHDGYNRYKIEGVGTDYYVNGFGQRMDMPYTDANFELIEDVTE